MQLVDSLVQDFPKADRAIVWLRSGKGIEKIGINLIIISICVNNSQNVRIR